MDDLRGFNDDLFDAAMKEALRQLACEEELEAERLLDSMREESSGIVPSRKFKANMRYLIRRAGKPKAPARIYPRAVRIAAMFALVLGIGAAAALGVSAYRNSMYGWAVRQNSVYTQLEQNTAIVEECDSFIFSETNWDYFYFPEYLPTNFQLENVDADFNYVQIQLAHADQEIALEQNSTPEENSYYAECDTETTGGFQKVNLGEYECYFVKKVYPGNIQTIQIICNNEDFWMRLLFRNISQKEAFRIVESLKKIEKK